MNSGNAAPGAKLTICLLRANCLKLMHGMAVFPLDAGAILLESEKDVNIIF
jgi:hypothetical protein